MIKMFKSGNVISYVINDQYKVTPQLRDLINNIIIE